MNLLQQRTVNKTQKDKPETLKLFFCKLQLFLNHT